MTLVPVHAEAGSDPQELRWVMPARTLGFVGAVADCPEPLRGLVDSGTVACLEVEPGAVLTRLSAGLGWRDVGPAVRTALQTALADPSGWCAADPEAASDDSLLRAVVEEVLRGEAGDFVRSHGGVITPVRIADGVVELAMEGACARCPATGFTLTQRLEKAIRRGHPTLREVRRHHPLGMRP